MASFVATFRRETVSGGCLRRRFRRDDAGATAIEFAILALPLFMFIFGIMNTGYFFFNQHMLDRGVEEASRRVRTGEAQKLGTNVGAYRNLICNAANGNISAANTGYGPPPSNGIIDCSKVTVLLQSAGDWADLGGQSCFSAGNQSTSTGNPTDSLSGVVGTQGRIVLITACYRWDLPGQLPFLRITNLGDSFLYSSSAAFRTEEYQ